MGSKAEAEAAAYIENCFKGFGFSNIQHYEYECKFYDAKGAKVGLPDDSIIIDGVPCWMSASTSPEGLIAKSTYVGPPELVSNLSPDEVEIKLVFALVDLQFGKSVLEAWEHLYALSPAGVIFLDIARNEAPRTYTYEGLSPLFSQAPSMVVSARKAADLHSHMLESKLKMQVDGNPEDGVMHNVAAKVQGAKEQTILVCAHHDAHILTSGATDNAAGVAIMLEIARGLAKTKPNFSYQFVSFGGEELEMRGSRKHVAEQALDDVALCMNFDSIGALPGVLLALSAGHDDMIDWVTETAKSNHYPARCRRTSTTGGDNIIFAANGIPTIHFAAMGTTTEKVSHSAIDVPSLLRPRDLEELGRFASAVIEALDQSNEFPFPLEVPDDLQKNARIRVGIQDS
jgi:hypothetical protein